MLPAFLDSPAMKLSGAEIHRQSDVFTGTLYPMLVRFEAAGSMDSKWEDINREAAQAALFAHLHRRGARECYPGLGLSPVGRGLSWT